MPIIETKPTTHQRKFGLDLLRALAILFVLYAHSLKYTLALISHSTFNQTKLDGVTIFFVLSGFLIGQIIIKTYEKTDKFTFGVLSNFWQRRWLRTLPIYFLILMINYVLIGYNMDVNILPYLTFTQNLFSPHPVFFEIAWSLSVEEWFYLLIPFVLFIISFFSKNKKFNLLLIIISVVLICLALRGYELTKYDVIDNKQLNPIFRKIVIFRLDSIIFGVLAAYCKYYHRAFWNKSKYLFLFLGFACIFLLKLYPLIRHNIYFYYLFGSNLLALATMFLLPFLDDMKAGSSWFHKLITHISLISYALYLTHTLVLGGLNILKISSPIINLVLYLIVAIIISTILYYGFERPILKWRDRKIPDVLKAKS